MSEKIYKRTGHSLISLLAIAFAAIFPFLFYYDYLPLTERPLYIGNDFGPLYYKYKHYLLSALSQGFLPLWSPSEASGFPFYSSPFTQTFYPLNLILLAYYDLMGGYSRLDHQLFTIMGVSIFNLGLFLWLRALRFPWYIALSACCAIAVSLKIGEILRLPNAVHSAAWYPWILFSITNIASSSRFISIMGHGVVLTLSLVMLVTAGYPYYLYYLPFLAIPYTAAMLCKASAKVSFLLRSLVLSGAVLVSGGAVAPYLLKVRELMSLTVGRQGSNYSFATSHQSDSLQTLGSLIFPPCAITEGWMYFGLIGLLIIAWYWGYLVASFRGWTQKQKNDAGIFIILILWILIISSITHGQRSFLFNLGWSYLPGFSSLRVWPRMNIIILPALCWLLALSLSRLCELQDEREDSNSNRKNRWISLVSLLSCGVVFGAQWLFFLFGTRHEYWNLYHTSLYPRISVVMGLGVVAGAFMLIWTVARMRGIGGPPMKRILIVGFVLLTFSELWVFGKEVWVERRNIEVRERHGLDVKGLLSRSMETNRTLKAGTVSLTPIFYALPVEDWNFDHYFKFLERVKSQALEFDSAKILLAVSGSTDRLFLSEGILHQSVPDFLMEATPLGEQGKIIHYDGDQLTVEVHTERKLFLSFIDNWDPDWEARINGKPVPIHLLFNTFKAVELSTAGRHLVEFRYRPKLFGVSLFD